MPEDREEWRRYLPLLAVGYSSIINVRERGISGVAQEL